MTSVVTPDQDTLSHATTERRGRTSRHCLLAGLGSGVLLWMAFPPVEWAWLAWLALAPLFWLVTLRDFRSPAYLGAWAGGLVFWLLALEWLRMLDANAWLGWFVLALVFSLWWLAFLALARWAFFRLRIPLLFAAPITWVGLEYARAYFLTGFPWYYLAHSQYRFLYVIQIADFSSSLGVSLLIAIVNAVAVDLLTLPLFRSPKPGKRLTARQNLRICLVTILLGTTLCYGAFRVSTAQFRDGPKLALLQSNIEQRHKLKGDRSPQIIAEFAGLIERALKRTELPDLLVWPETSYPYNFVVVDPATEQAALESQVKSVTKKLSVDQWLERRDLIVSDLHFRTDNAQVPMLVGSIYFDHRPKALERYNSAILFKPQDQAIHFYHKMHLVPFGEYFPLIETFPWLAALTPYHGEKIQSLSFGREPLTLPLGPYKLAVSICFEDTIPQVIRRFFAVAPDGHEPDVLINLSNDGWYHGSAELDIHLAIGVFRAVEHRVPLARAVNTGMTALVDGNGEIRESLPKETQGVLSVTVPLDDRTTWYSRWGDWLGLTCLAISIGLVPLGWARKQSAPEKRV
jgi:apolipoprotein N-acyltransferase